MRRENTLESLRMGRNMAKVNINFKMDLSMKVIMKMVKEMELVLFLRKTVL